MPIASSFDDLLLMVKLSLLSNNWLEFSGLSIGGLGESASFESEPASFACHLTV
jgi:hypothetical protein